MKCERCSHEFEEGVCKGCWNQFMRIAWDNLIKPDPYFDFKNQIKENKYAIEDRLTSIEIELKELNTAIKDFKIKGLSLKSTKEKPN